MLRKGFIRLRKDDDPALRAPVLETSTAGPETLMHVVRAFNSYFSLVNIAEESFQHKERRRLVNAGVPLWIGSFDHTLREFHASGITPAQLQTLLEQARVRAGVHRASDRIEAARRHAGTAQHLRYRGNARQTAH